MAIVKALSDNARKADYEWLKRSVIRRRWQRDDWQEVLLLLVAMLSGKQSPVAEMIEYLRNMRLSGPPVNLSFAVQCLSESGVIEDRQAASALLGELVEAIAEHAALGRRTSSMQFVDRGLKAFPAAVLLVPVPVAAKEVIDRLRTASSVRERMAGWQMGLAQRSRDERLEFALEALADREGVGASRCNCCVRT